MPSRAARDEFSRRDSIVDFNLHTMATTRATVRALPRTRIYTNARNATRTRTSAPSPRASSPPRAIPLWRVPDGSNPLEALFASDSPIDGLGALTGYWYADVFAAMNVALLLALALYASDGE